GDCIDNVNINPALNIRKNNIPIHDVFIKIMQSIHYYNVNEQLNPNAYNWVDKNKNKTIQHELVSHIMNLLIEINREHYSNFLKNQTIKIDNSINMNNFGNNLTLYILKLEQ